MPPRRMVCVFGQFSMRRASRELLLGRKYVRGSGHQSQAPVGSAPMNQGDRCAFGDLLREWRAARGMSQLDLALSAGVSARHVSFIETGRSTPSRSMILLLADVLDVPLRQRNRLLETAGYANAYVET